MKIHRFPNTINYNICDSTILVTVNQAYRIRKSDPKFKACLFIGGASLLIPRNDAAHILRTNRKKGLAHAG